MTETEIELKGGNSQAVVVKVGNTVRRAMSEASPSIHRLLTHLEKEKFNGSPRVLGVDEKGREILTFVEGSCEIDAAVWTSNAILVSAAKLLRDLHNTTASFSSDENERWGFVYPDHSQHEVICHNDFGLYNVVISDDKCIGVIDFDAAGPGPRLRDIAYAAYWFTPISQQADDMKSFAIADVRNHCVRLKEFCHSYGVSADLNLLDMIEEVLSDMANEKLMQELMGIEQTERLKRDGHLDFWTKEALAFREYRHTIESALQLEA